MCANYTSAVTEETLLLYKSLSKSTVLSCFKCESGGKVLITWWDGVETLGLEDFNELDYLE